MSGKWKLILLLLILWISASQGVEVDPTKTSLTTMDGTSSSGTGLTVVEVGARAAFQIHPKDSTDTACNSACDGVDSLQFIIYFQKEIDSEYMNVSIDTTIDYSNYIYTVEYSTQVSGNYLMHILLVDTYVKGSPVSVLINPGALDATKSYATGSGSNQMTTAGQMSVFGFKFLDKFSNPADVPLATITFEANYKTSPGIVDSSVSMDGTEPVFQYRANITDTVTLKITVGGVLIWQLDVIVVPGTIDPSQCSCDFSPLTAPTTAAGITTTLTLSARDSYLNIIKPSLISNDPAQFKAIFTLLTASGEETNITYSYDTTLDTAQVDKAKAYVVQFGPLTIAGYYTLQIQRSGIDISGSPFNFSLPAADISGTESTIVGDWETPRVVGSPNTFTIITRDKYHNVKTQGSNNTTPFTIEVFDSKSVIHPQIIDEKNGNYTITFSFEQSGLYVMEAYYYFDKLPESGRSIQAYTVSSSADSVAYGAGIKNCKVGDKCRFIIQIRDRFGNNQTSNTDTIDITINAKPLEFTTTWLGDGIHAVEYVGTNGDKIEILVNGEKIQGSPFPVYISPSDSAIGVIIAIVIIVTVLLALTGFVIYKRWQIAQLRKEWELKKALAYKEYQTSQGPPVPLNNMAGQSDEPEWEDDEFENYGNDHADENIDDNEWRTMSQWIQNSKRD